VLEWLELKVPVQDRSRKSLERIFNAVEGLIVACGSADFTMQEVSQKSELAIGSIYSRFKNKDALLHVVHERFLERVDVDLRQRVTLVRAETRNLPDLMAGLVEALGETLRFHAKIMRPFMDLANFDAVIAENGKRYHRATADCIKSAIVQYNDEVHAGDKADAVDMAFTVIYAVIARYLGYGSSSTAANEGDWDKIKLNLSKMITSYLQSA
jgi:AcrR family transcriptional regulator